MASKQPATASAGSAGRPLPVAGSRCASAARALRHAPSSNALNIDRSAYLCCGACSLVGLRQGDAIVHSSSEMSVGYGRCSASNRDGRSGCKFITRSRKAAVQQTPQAGVAAKGRARSEVECRGAGLRIVARRRLVGAPHPFTMQARAPTADRRRPGLASAGLLDFPAGRRQPSMAPQCAFSVPRVAACRWPTIVREGHASLRDHRAKRLARGSPSFGRLRL